MTARELYNRIGLELKRRREQFYDDPRNATDDCEKNETIVLLREAAVTIRSEYEGFEKWDQ